MQGDLQLKLSHRSGNVIFEASSTNCGLEVGGIPWSGSWNNQS